MNTVHLHLLLNHVPIIGALTEEHEEAALLATIVMGGVGLLSVIALGAFRKRSLARWVAPALMVLAIGATATMGYAANLGGQIRHTEIRSDIVVPPNGEEPERDRRGER
jgi:hypothetical protein